MWAAISAAREGARVLVVERAPKIGERIACAEGVDAEGLERLVPVRPEWVASAISNARLYSPEGACTEVQEHRVGFIVRKDVFLTDLARAAGDLGAEIMLGSEALDVRAQAGRQLAVELLSGSRPRTVECGAVVAADGMESSIGRRLGIVDALKPAQLFSCAQDTVAPIEVDGDAVEIHFGRNVAPGGYAWVFPKGKDTANVGVGIAAGDGRNLTAVQYLARFKQARCPESKVLRSIVGGVPSEKSPFRACRRGVFLAGDAARVADPVTGAGIVQGMRSGAQSGRHAFIYSKGEEKPAKVEKAFAQALRSEFDGRALRWAVRQVLANMSDRDLSAMVRLIGEYRLQGVSMAAHPVALVRFLASAMPNAFKLAGHLVGV